LWVLLRLGNGLGLMPSGRVSFTGEFSPNPYLKNMIFGLQEGFSIKKRPKFAKSQKKFYISPDFYY
jgi:hypothetical protein